MEHYLYHFNKVSEPERDLLIAVLSDLQFNGFEELETDLLAYIPVKDAELLPDTVIRQLGYTFSVKLVEPKNWNEEWESSFQPVTIPDTEIETPQVYIHASFHQPHPAAVHNIAITPKMSFGTGHHQTTYLMIEEMLSMEWKGKTVVDFGTGTGVLAILAAKLGSTSVKGIDYDEWCILNAQENIIQNNTSHIDLIQEDMFGQTSADTILANINLNVILDNITNILQSLLPGGTLLLSGMLVQDETLIRKTLTQHHCSNITVKPRGNWILVRIDKD